MHDGNEAIEKMLESEKAEKQSNNKDEWKEKSRAENA